MKGVAITLGLAVAGVTSIGFVLLRDPAPRLDPSDDRSISVRETSDDDAAPAAPDSLESDSDSRATVAIEATPGSAQPGEFRGDGSIALRVVDATTSEPIPGFPFICYSERPRIHVFTRGVTDEKGEALIRDLPEDVVIFETPRRPPHANTVFATSLSARQHEQVEMRVGRGGSARGRVVDDLGRPLEGVEVTTAPWPGAYTLDWSMLASVKEVDTESAKRFAIAREIVTKTDALGRYQVDSIQSRPSAFSIDGQAMSPKRVEPVGLQFSWRRCGAFAGSKVREGEVVELPDVVFDRTRLYCGRVLDSEGRPVSAAIVTLRLERWYQLGQRAFEEPFVNERPGMFGDVPEGSAFRFDLGPWEPDFTLAAGEAVTDADGSFEIESSQGEWTMAIVVAPSGSRKQIELPKALPGSRTEGLEFRLPVETQLLLEISEPDGQPLPAKTSRGMTVRPSAVAITRSGREVPGEMMRAPSTRFGVRFEVDAAELARIVVSAADHVTVIHEFASPPVGRPTISLVLRPKETFELLFRFRFADQADDAEVKLLSGANLTLSVGPNPLPGRRGPGSSEFECSVAIESRDFRLTGKREIKLAVPSRRAWFVALAGPFGPGEESVWPIELGRFEPDGTTHEIELPRASEAWMTARAEEERGKKESQKSGGLLNRREPQGIASMTLIDRATRAPIPFTRCDYKRESGSDESPVHWYASSGEQGGRSYPVLCASPGHYTFRVVASGYRPSEPIDVTIVADESVHLGEVELESCAVRRLRLVPDAGAPAPAGFGLVLLGHDELKSEWSFHGFEIFSDANGVATIRSDLPERFQVLAYPKDCHLSGPVLPARFELTPWPLDETLEVALPTLRHARVLVDVSAVDADLRDRRCSISVRFDGEARSMSGQASQSVIQDPTVRHFTFQAPAGRYVLSSRGSVFDIPETVVELVETTEEQRFTLTARIR